MFKAFDQLKRTRAFRGIQLVLAVVLSFSLSCPPAYAQSILPLPPPGMMVNISAGYQPAVILGVTVNANNPLALNFVINKGDDLLDGYELEDETQRLIKYFLASLTVPEEDMWVNLSPYERNRIIPEQFGFTEMGRDLLAQDYVLKQLTASLMYPEDELGEKFWDRIYAKAKEIYGDVDIPANTFNKIWIIPEKAVVYEHEGTAFVVDRHLKVMLEEDYLAANEAKGFQGQLSEDVDLTEEMKEIIREVLIPEIEREVNEGQNFANLRQIFNSMILATWFKRSLQNSLLGQVYVDQKKVKGVDIENKEAKFEIYEQYLTAFKEGVYDYIKEEYDPLTQQVIPRRYFSGGITTMRTEDITFVDSAMLSTQPLDVQYAVEDFADDIDWAAQNNRIVDANIRLTETGEVLTNDAAMLSVGITGEVYRGMEQMGYSVPSNIRDEFESTRLLDLSELNDMDLIIDVMRGIYERMGLVSDNYHNHIHNIGVTNAMAIISKSAGLLDSERDAKVAFLSAMLHDFHIRQKFKPARLGNQEEDANIGTPASVDETLRQIKYLLGMSEAQLPEEERFWDEEFLDDTERLAEMIRSFVGAQRFENTMAEVEAMIRRTDFASDVKQVPGHNIQYKTAAQDARRKMDSTIMERISKSEDIGNNVIEEVISRLRQRFEQISVNATRDPLIDDADQPVIYDWLQRQLGIEIAFLEALKNVDTQRRPAVFTMSNFLEKGADQSGFYWIGDSTMTELDVIPKLAQEIPAVSVPGSYPFFFKLELLNTEVLEILKYLPDNYKENFLKNISYFARKTTEVGRIMPEGAPFKDIFTESQEEWKSAEPGVRQILFSQTDATRENRRSRNDQFFTAITDLNDMKGQFDISGINPVRTSSRMYEFSTTFAEKYIDTETDPTVREQMRKVWAFVLFQMINSNVSMQETIIDYVMATLFRIKTATETDRPELTEEIGYFVEIATGLEAIDPTTGESISPSQSDISVALSEDVTSRWKRILAGTGNDISMRKMVSTPVEGDAAMLDVLNESRTLRTLVQTAAVSTLLCTGACGTTQVGQRLTAAQAAQQGSEYGIYPETTFNSETLFYVDTIDDLVRNGERLPNGLIRIGNYDVEKPIMIVIHGANDNPARAEAYLREYEGEFNIYAFKYDHLTALGDNANLLRRKIRNIITPLNNDTVFFNNFSYGHHVFMEAVLLENEDPLTSTDNVFFGVNVVHSGSVIPGSQEAEMMKYEPFLVDPVSLIVRNFIVDDQIRFARTLEPAGEQARRFMSNYDEFLGIIGSIRGVRIDGDSNDPGEDSDADFMEMYSDHNRRSNMKVLKRSGVDYPHTVLLDGEGDSVRETMRLVDEMLPIYTASDYAQLSTVEPSSNIIGNTEDAAALADSAMLQDEILADFYTLYEPVTGRDVSIGGIMETLLRAAGSRERFVVFIRRPDAPGTAAWVSTLSALDRKIYISDSFMRALNNGDATIIDFLAVMAHEIGHLALGHSIGEFIADQTDEELQDILADSPEVIYRHELEAWRYAKDLLDEMEIEFGRPGDAGYRTLTGLEVIESHFDNSSELVRKGYFPQVEVWDMPAGYPTRDSIFADLQGVPQKAAVRESKFVVNAARPAKVNTEDLDALPEPVMRVRPAASGDAAQLSTGTDNVGGIDFNPGIMDLQIKRDDTGVPLPMNMQNLPNINIEGLYPVIINITPISNPLPLLGMNDGGTQDSLVSRS